MKIKGINTIKMCLIFNMRRVADLLEEMDLDNVSYCYYEDAKKYAEVKQKMKEIRRDSMQIQKHLEY